ncbi:hypothetical protein DM01DRAFT_1411450 [Hesseltinella vesiculosa]|uniref:GATA-type domain-containing protein n=1 Tax=Hesseltinella vesiculosa TaxID=101127 RepID=A0A1X2G3T4_9FUNG|nr:hypothetical protein DM01DRAFT_1411450 [Hesseltinella vesiculosa]
MSSAVLATKKKTELSVRKYPLPTRDTPDPVTTHLGDELCLSLCQSRLNWMAYFPKFTPDPDQQPKRKAALRHRFPCMQALGHAAMQLGPHRWDTAFFRADRANSWPDLCKALGTHLSDSDQAMTEVNALSDLPTTVPSLVFSDIVFEFSEQSHDRFVFPKNCLLQRLTDRAPHKIVVSFMIPLDEPTDAFFWPAEQKIQHFGPTSGIVEVEKLATTMSPAPAMDVDQHAEAVQLCISGASDELWHAMEASVYSHDQVCASASHQAANLSPQHYLDLHVDQDQRKAIQGLVQRLYTIPDLQPGPNNAEKKRSEMNFSVYLGKRPADSVSKGDKGNKCWPKGGGELWKCSYCGTRSTAMRRQGPLGEGSLCNGCGLLWKQGKILQGNKRSRPTNKKGLSTNDQPANNKDSQRQSYHDWLQQQLDHKKQPAAQSQSPSSTPPPSTNPTSHSASPIDTSNDAPHRPTATATRQPSNDLQDTTMTMASRGGSMEASAETPDSTESLNSISLPTVNVEFAQQAYYHPHCTTSIDKDLLCLQLKHKDDTSTLAHIAIPRAHLVGHTDLTMVDKKAVDTESDLLLMTCHPKDVPPLTVSVQGTKHILYDPKNPQNAILKIRFLENLDPSTGQPLVKKIIQRWLQTT